MLFIILILVLVLILNSKDWTQDYESENILMRLDDLAPAFIKYENNSIYPADNIWEATGIEFMCPICYLNDDKEHSIICWDSSIPQYVLPNPGRWDLEGNDFEDLSLIGNTTSSVRLMGGCRAHFLIKDGNVIGE